MNQIQFVQKESPLGAATESAHPAGFSPDDKYSKARFLLKRFGLLPIQGAPVKPRVCGACSGSQIDLFGDGQGLIYVLSDIFHMQAYQLYEWDKHRSKSIQQLHQDHLFILVSLTNLFSNTHNRAKIMRDLAWRAGCKLLRTTVTLKMLETEFPVFNVILKNYPPPAPESLLPKVAPVAQMGVTVLIVCGEHIFPMIRIFDPPAWYYSLRANSYSMGIGQFSFSMYGHEDGLPYRIRELEEIAYGPPTTFRRNSDGCKEVRRNSVGIVQSQTAIQRSYVFVGNGHMVRRNSVGKYRWNSDDFAVNRNVVGISSEYTDELPTTTTVTFFIGMSSKSRRKIPTNRMSSEFRRKWPTEFRRLHFFGFGRKFVSIPSQMSDDLGVRRKIRRNSIVDDGHRLENENPKLFYSLKQFTCENHVLLTGRPLRVVNSEQQAEQLSALGKRKRNRKQIVEKESEPTDGEAARQGNKKTRRTYHRRRTHLCSGPRPLIEGQGKSLRVLGFRKSQRKTFLDTLMRYGVGNYDWKEFVYPLMWKTYDEINNYGKFFLEHIIKDTQDTNPPTFSDMAPKIGLTRDKVLARITVMMLLQEKLRCLYMWIAINVVV
ncbi:hypothetical protein F2Q69_00057822 [Brassica cretica]|uniref:Nucleolar protein 10 n=3 Tax=Brassica cretica TaxID=69181 RepID=A0A8S9MPS5_BRACR|nr:hypothetical protein F2Q69_00057822 [Brassica cretica]